MINDLIIELSKYLQKQFLYKTPPARRSSINKINFGAKIGLQFRFRPYKEDILAIARIFLLKKEKDTEHFY